MDFLTELRKRILVLDGSMGALIQNRGLPAGMAPDVWMMDNQDIIYQVHKEYVDAGADIILTNTFGSTRWRLEEYQSAHRMREIVAKATELARKAMGDKGFVAGDIGPSGETIFPTGKKSFEEVAEVFYEQAKICVELGVDVIVAETMFDSIEYRAACSGIRAASSKIPLIALATFNSDAKTDTGAIPENISAIAEGFHAHAVGVNCSIGPEPMVEVVRRMSKSTTLAVAVQPNAGLPFLKEGRNHFPMTAEDLRPYIDQFIEAGANIIGGCCGTTPQYIKYVKERVRGVQPPQKLEDPRTIISSLAGFALLGGNQPFVGIGEKMNPSGRKKLTESLKQNDLTLLLEDAKAQVQAGGKIFDLNVGVPLADEPALMKRAVVAVQNQCPEIPLMIDSANSHALDTGSSVYYGRPLLNSINAEQEKLDEMIPIVKKHGAAIVCMTTGVDVPRSAEERLQNAKKITDLLLGKHGLREEDLVFDCLGLVVSAMQDGSIATLKTIELIKEYFPRSATTLGLSNVSFGLPNRSFVHNAFLALAIQRGLDSAIMSVTDVFGRTIAGASQMWSPKKGSIENFITHFEQKVELGTSKAGGAAHTAGASDAPTSSGADKSGKVAKEPEWVSSVGDLEKIVFRGIVDGRKDAVVAAITEFADKYPEKAMDIFLNVMTPAIRHLGDLFAQRIKFIPHLMSAAEAMKAGVAILEPLLAKLRAAGGEKKGTIVFATVKGDIHDIGKNICILMLRNFGFEVIDLGRNVDPEVILNTAVEKKADVVALSALMTTTMMQMKVVIDRVKAGQLPFKVVIGGAVVTPDFARDIHADGYSTDVGTVVSEMERALVLLRATGATT